MTELSTQRWSLCMSKIDPFHSVLELIAEDFQHIFHWWIIFYIDFSLSIHSINSRMFYLLCASLIIMTSNTLYSPLERTRRLHNWGKTFRQKRPIFSVFSFRVLRDNPLECSCDIHWLQQWQLNDHSDLDKQPLHCLSNGHARRLDSLLMENCSELNW